MVRTVEPDPPEPLRRIDPRVPRTESKPDKLGHQRVSERQERPRERHEPPKEHPTDGDRVTLQRDAQDTESPVDKPEAPEQPPPSHIDVEG